MAMSVTYTTFNGQLVKENRGGTESFYAPDTLGSTAALLSTTGSVTDTYDYWPYGEIRNHSGSSITPFTYVGTFGYYLQILNNFSYVRDRFLRQGLARWQSLDPFWPEEMPYAYVESSPTVYVDPTGDGQLLCPPTLAAICQNVFKDCDQDCNANHSHSGIGVYKACKTKCLTARMHCLNDAYGLPPDYVAPPHVGKGPYKRFKDRKPPLRLGGS